MDSRFKPDFKYDKRDPKTIQKLEPFFDGLYKHYFRCKIIGWENIPDHKVLFTSNHNGILTFEMLMLFYAWWKRFGTTRKALGLAHDLAVDSPFFKWICPKIGAIPASPEIAMEAFAKDYSLLVYPGGLKEAFRPFKDRKKLDFYQRKGFVRLALRAGVPIVPVVSVGAAESYVVLNRGEELAKKLGVYEKFRLAGIPITYRSIFFFWCLATGIFTFLPLLIAPIAFVSIFIPLPTQMTFRFLEPVDVTALVKPELTEEENHQQIYDHILAIMRKAHDEEYEKRKLPIVG